MNILWFKDCNYNNKYLVGGKNASLGELYRLSNLYSFNISNGFAITTFFYDTFINDNHLNLTIKAILNNHD